MDGIVEVKSRRDPMIRIMMMMQIAVKPYSETRSIRLVCQYVWMVATDVDGGEHQRENLSQESF